MTRDMLVRVAGMVLHQRGVAGASEHATAIAGALDMFAAVLGEPAPPATAQAGAPGTGMPFTLPPFPAPPPEAIVAAQPEPAAPLPSLIIPATSIPDRVERVVDPSARMLSPDAPPVRSLRPSGRMKVEDLNQFIQDRTPPHITFEVQAEDGPRRITYDRNVISQHGSDSVQLIYYPPNTTQSAREAAEVMFAIHVDDMPIDLNPILRKLAAQAAEAIRPRRAIIAAEPAPTAGTVKHSGDTYKDPSIDLLNAGTSAMFNSLPRN